MKNFDSIGKKMPYKVPSGFFEEFPTKVMDRINHRPSFWSLYARYAIAAAVVLTLGLGSWLFVENYMPSKGNDIYAISMIADTTISRKEFKKSAPSIDEVISNMSDEELDNILNSGDLDIYY